MLSPRRSLAALALLTAVPGTSLADERQLHLDLHLGYASSSGPLGGLGSLAQAGLSYGLNDALSLYASGGYSLQILDAPRTPRHSGSLSLGVAYAFDHLRVVPYGALGLRADLLSTPGLTWFTPSAEVRGGLLYLLRRGLSLGLEAAYAYPVLNTEKSADFFSITLGARFTWDL